MEEREIVNTGVVTLTSNNDHIHIKGTEESDIELLSLKGNSFINPNACTYDRFNNGIEFQFEKLYFNYDLNYDTVYKNYGKRLIYDSKGKAYPTCIIEQRNAGGLLNIFPNATMNNVQVVFKIQIHENTLQLEDSAYISVMNLLWNIKVLEPGIYEMPCKFTNETNKWLPLSWNRIQFLKMEIVNPEGIRKVFDMEFLDVKILELEEKNSTQSNAFESLEMHSISVQEQSLEPWSQYKASNDFASRLNILNKKILEMQNLIK